MTLQLIESHQCFDGCQRTYKHWSNATKCEMHFAIYLPPMKEGSLVPGLYWLSGLTSSEQNFITKAGAQRMAADLGLAIIVSDTSPRGLDLAETYKRDNVGEGASFYVDATENPWRKHYQMYTYISRELPDLITKHFPIDPARCGIFGHSMGGHGALMIGLRNPHLYRSLSAFAPIGSLMNAPWGIEALRCYLGEHQENWKAYDACYLIKKHGWPHGTILIDQGDADPFLMQQLQPERLVTVCIEANVPLQLCIREGYDHGYYFIATFIEEHLRFHAECLNEKTRREA